ncbi:hypothetical protein T484DRAFT_1780171 [Baffinella frigidus]|nr:hypothetical protein T484DRAFT_1780171 [Cryptophyta sp. CCMP2293]
MQGGAGGAPGFALFCGLVYALDIVLLRFAVGCASFLWGGRRAAFPGWGALREWGGVKLCLGNRTAWVVLHAVVVLVDAVIGIAGSAPL